MQAIVPNINATPSYSIRISEATDENGVVSYRAEKQTEDQGWELIGEFGTEDKDLLLEFYEPIDIVSEESVQDWALDKIESGYFDIAKNALQIFNGKRYWTKTLKNSIYLRVMILPICWTTFY